MGYCMEKTSVIYLIDGHCLLKLKREDIWSEITVELLTLLLHSVPPTDLHNRLSTAQFEKFQREKAWLQLPMSLQHVQHLLKNIYDCGLNVLFCSFIYFDCEHTICKSLVLMDWWLKQCDNELNLFGLTICGCL
nr:uncharacterized protein LOC117275707 [Nicotiana tomentosiformis]